MTIALNSSLPDVEVLFDGLLVTGLLTPPTGAASVCVVLGSDGAGVRVSFTLRTSEDYDAPAELALREAAIASAITSEMGSDVVVLAAAQSTSQVYVNIPSPPPPKATSGGSSSSSSTGTTSTTSGGVDKGYTRVKGFFDGIFGGVISDLYGWIAVSAGACLIFCVCSLVVRRCRLRRKRKAQTHVLERAS
ncbi:hypothetical protein T492DRAFT_1127249 [Pavlovales sp. CCMP2436]|nr:hypothetical protein T492DRAFT_1127249 [Pavlovales sp. CCMP2436]